MAKPENVGKLPPFSFLKLTRIYYRQFWGSWLTLIIFVFLTTAVTVVTPKLINILLNEVYVHIFNKQIPHISEMIIIYWAIGFACAVLFLGISRFIQNLAGGRFARKVEIDIRLKVLNKLLDLDMGYYKDKKIGEILTKLISDTQILGDQTYQVPRSMLSALFSIVGTLIILFTFNSGTPVMSGQPAPSQSSEYELIGIVWACCVAILIITIILFVFLRKRIYLQRKVITEINGKVNDRVTNLKLIKATGNTRVEQKTIKNLHHRYLTVSMDAIKLQSLALAILLTALGSINIIATLVVAAFVNLNKVSIAILTPITLALNNLVMPMFLLINLLSNLASASTSATRVQEILEVNPKLDPHWDQPMLTLQNKGITFENVSFTYDEEDDKTPAVLKNFSFHFAPNRSYAIVGESGVGKTTIVSLLLRLYDPQKGRILVDETYDLKTINLKCYLDTVGYVEQEPQIIYGNFYDNIAYGLKNQTKDAIIAAAQKAKIHDFIMERKEQYDTLLGERGFLLSTGQKQRVVIARMFLKNPAVLILDEATSALDNIVEKSIQKQLEALSANRTSITIAHRLSTIQNVDEIIVLAKNKGIVQKGTWNELINQPGHFSDLYQSGIIESERKSNEP